MPTLIYTAAAPPATFVQEDENVVRAELDRAAAAGEEFVAFEGEGGKGVRIAVADVKPLGDDRWWVSGQ